MTRSEAKAAGKKYYDEGRRLCPQAHLPNKRWTSTGKCFWCARPYERERRRQDAPNRTAMTKEWRRLNPDKVEASNARRDPAMLRRISREWRIRNPEQAAVTAATSKAKRRGAAGKFKKSDIVEIMRLQKGKCAYCRIGLKEKRDIDHIVPLSKGGTNERKNLQLLCRPCNQRKHARDPIAFAQHLGLLI